MKPANCARSTSSRRCQEAAVTRIRQFLQNASWMIAVSCAWLAQSAAMAQQPAPTRPGRSQAPAQQPGVEVLPDQDDVRTPANAVAPPPVTPPTIVAVEAQPID